ncbi:hypothetical protein GCM10010400_11050 [Streptomyces aculeolatus]
MPERPRHRGPVVPAGPKAGVYNDWPHHAISQSGSLLLVETVRNVGPAGWIGSGCRVQGGS